MEQGASHYSLPIFLYPRKKEFKDFMESYDFIANEMKINIYTHSRTSPLMLNGPLSIETSHQFTDAFYNDLVKKKIDETHFSLSIPINYGFDPDFNPIEIKDMSIFNKNQKLIFDFDGQIIPK